MITCFLLSAQNEDLKATTDELLSSSVVSQIFIIGRELPSFNLPENAQWMKGDGFHDVKTIIMAAESSVSEYSLFYTKTSPLKTGPFGLERMVQIAQDTGAGMVYSDHYKMMNGKSVLHPLIDYQSGSLRDDFDFGSLLLYRTDAIKNVAPTLDKSWQYGGLYALRLAVSRIYSVFRIPEFLYTEMETDNRASGEKIFDYVDPKNRAVQIEMEEICTANLKAIGGWLQPRFSEIDLSDSGFPVEASVIIPVRNRVKTIEDAIKSVLSQETKFPFNLIVVDNHSTDGTTELLQKMAESDEKLIHLIPDRNDLGIGGCWNYGVFHDACGKFAIQLDSDDLYINNQVIQTIVEAFYEQQCAMVVGSYQMVNFNLKEIPPGLIDHREWTPENGRNNALRINGLGAPRAFYTPVLREIRLPNTSYGEDYAVGLRISRQYQIGRIYEPLYLCRRWEENSDASLDVVKMNGHNLYKDRIRTIELQARINLNKEIN
ncbi:glycosyltransferase family 2 protein [Alkalitalea saponilacus]|uniref:Glycosyl transferase family 2 n=1 Tax=Alkalitalea saponilacus TaxID=889453 RepID=A0A1T5HRX7_9BACT|nr:glycosyltransferase family A protein [Alkalitalea saponilacus]ASB50036.1 glycosyl transferase [Alkalitalea saponilacus]SKC23449.1 Glycosyl transferase family 2 [Alkalitalea saponilacus]